MGKSTDGYGLTWWDGQHVASVRTDLKDDGSHDYKLFGVGKDVHFHWWLKPDEAGNYVGGGGLLKDHGDYMSSGFSFHGSSQPIGYLIVEKDEHGDVTIQLKEVVPGSTGYAAALSKPETRKKEKALPGTAGARRTVYEIKARDERSTGPSAPHVALDFTTGAPGLLLTLTEQDT
jgi:hypothetical protein